MNRADTPNIVQSLIVCPTCKLEMRLLGTEAENDIRDLYTFQCAMCGKLEVRGVLVAAAK